MSGNTNPQVRHAFEQWHAMVRSRDLEGIVALYAEDGTFESPAVLALNGGRDGILLGHDQLRSYFKIFFDKLDGSIDEWYRTGAYFTDGNTLTWEYPRKTPRGNQVDIVEWMDLRNGLIAEHRVYWGWIGLKTLLGSMDAKS
jgi:steroid delta-isomerase